MKWRVFGRSPLRLHRIEPFIPATSEAHGIAQEVIACLYEKTALHKRANCAGIWVNSDTVVVMFAT